MGGSSKKSVPSVPTERSSLQNPITFYKSRTGVYPSNSEMWWAYRRPLEIGTQEPPKNYLEVFDPALRHQITTGNSPAAKGHFILNAFHLDRSAASGVQGLPVVSSGPYRPTCVAFYAGRVFYAGINVAEFNTKIYFSQIIERDSQVQECYQALDPTNDELRDLLPSDGGVIVIPEITEVYHMHAMGQSLFVFARNGVWQITGSEGIGFKANDYSVSKIAGTPAIASLNFVIVEGAPLWWNKTGIYTITVDQLGQGHVQSLTDDSIKTFFDEIPVENKYYAKGVYDSLTQKVLYLFRSIPAPTRPDLFRYDKVLVLDTKTGAFYVHRFENGPRVYVQGIFNAEGFAVSTEQESVNVEDDLILVDDQDVYVLLEDRQPVQSVTKYVVQILDDTEGIPAPPPEEEIPDEPVFVLSDEAYVEDDFVYVKGNY